MKKYLVLLTVVVAFFACNKDDDPELDPEKVAAEQYTLDSTLIEQYLKDNNLKAEIAESGLFYIIDKQGTGEYPELSSIVKANYTGKLLNGTVFDNGTVEKYPLSAYIEGWQKGMPLFKEGGKGTLLLPSKLGYGAMATPSIPSHSILIFDIELLEVSK